MLRMLHLSCRQRCSCCTCRLYGRRTYLCTSGFGGTRVCLWGGILHRICTWGQDHHTATATPPLSLQQPAPKPSIFPSDSDAQHSFTYLWRFSESSRLISLISIAKSEFSCVLAHPTTRHATKTSPTPRPTAQTVWERVPSPCGPS
jgi:hypothetical protein